MRTFCASIFNTNAHYDLKEVIHSWYLVPRYVTSSDTRISISFFFSSQKKERFRMKDQPHGTHAKTIIFLKTVSLASLFARLVPLLLFFFFFFNVPFIVLVHTSPFFTGIYELKGHRLPNEQFFCGWGVFSSLRQRLQHDIGIQFFFLSVFLVFRPLPFLTPVKRHLHTFWVRFTCT